MRVIVAERDLEDTRIFCNQIRKLMNTNNVSIGSTEEEVLSLVRQDSVCLVFLEVNYQGPWGGIELAAKIHLINLDAGIVFISDSTHYAYYAFHAEAIGYLLRPYSKIDVEKQLERFERLRGTRIQNRVYIQTFGGFEISVDDSPLHFSRSKAKEMLALLVDRRGATLSASQMIAALWEEREEDEAVRDYYKKVLQCLKRELQRAGVEEILIDTGRGKALNVKKVRCDYYDFLLGREMAREMYLGDYMPQYSWAEETNGELYRMR